MTQPACPYCDSSGGKFRLHEGKIGTGSELSSPVDAHVHDCEQGWVGFGPPEIAPNVLTAYPLDNVWDSTE